MKDLITEARELCERATGGPWTGEENSGVQTATGEDVFQTGCGCCTSPHLSADDAAFIARSRTLVPELCDALEKAQAEIERLREATRWIPVTERTPENTKDDWVLAQITETNGYKWIPKVMEYRERTGDWYCDEIGWLKDHKDSFIVTHWMPLPAAPEEGAEHERD